MQQYFLSIDGGTNPAGALLVREPDGVLRAARSAEILTVARELVMIDELRGDYLGKPETVRTFLRLRLAGLEHEVCGLLMLDNRLHLIAYLEPFRGTLNQAPVYPREVVKLALKHNAAAMVMVHYVPRHIMHHHDGCCVVLQGQLDHFARIHRRLADAAVEHLDVFDQVVLRIQQHREHFMFVAPSLVFR